MGFLGFVLMLWQVCRFRDTSLIIRVRNSLFPFIFPNLFASVVVSRLYVSLWVWDLINEEFSYVWWCFLAFRNIEFGCPPTIAQHHFAWSCLILIKHFSPSLSLNPFSMVSCLCIVTSLFDWNMIMGENLFWSIAIIWLPTIVYLAWIDVVT